MNKLHKLLTLIIFACSFGISSATTLYVIGEMGLDGESEDPNRQIGFRPDLGVKMDSKDGNIFTATIHFWNVDGGATHNFGFCKKDVLADSPTDWNAINDYRIGSISGNTAIADGGTYTLGEQAVSKENFFVAETGTYRLTVNLSEKTLSCNKIMPIWILGEMGLDGDNETSGFSTNYTFNRGIRMTSTDGINYTARVHFWHTSGSATHNFGFLMRDKLGSDWEEIADYRFAAETGITAIESGKTYKYGELYASKENHFVAETGTYDITLNTESKTITTVRNDRVISKTEGLWILGEMGLDGENEDPNYYVNFRADRGIKFDTKDGITYTATVHFWSTSGNNSHNFGLCKSYGIANNITEWDYIAQYRIGAVTAGTAVQSGVTYPLGEQGTSKENFFVAETGTYFITVNLEENTICCKKIEPLWILGEMGLDGFSKNSNYQVGYRPDTGVKMHSTDGNIYTADVYFWNKSGSATHNFGLCKKLKLASAADKWNEINSFRIGAVSGNTNITSGTTYSLGAIGSSKENFFVIPTAPYRVAVNLAANTIKCTRSKQLWILGEMGLDGENEDPNSQIAFRPDVGFAMTSDDGRIFTATVHFWDIAGKELHNFGFCMDSSLASSGSDWNAIANYRVGATAANTLIEDGKEYNLGEKGVSKENFFRIPTGTWNLTVDITNGTLICEKAETLANETWDTYSDTWVAQDELGRTVQTSDNGLSIPQQNRTIGMFYYICNGPHGTEGDPIYDITEILKATPSNPQFGPKDKPHWWARPWLGYYDNSDAFVINKHLQMFVDAGIDLLFFDVTNAFTYDDTVRLIMKIIDARTSAGLKSPKLCYTVNAGATNVVRHLYNNFYSNPENKKYWYYHLGKPLMLVNIDALSDLEANIKNHFTTRHCWAWMDYSKPNKWGWVEYYPQGNGWTYDAKGNKVIEQISVATAQHASTKVGKSYHGGAQPSIDKYGVCADTPKGLYFEEQWSQAHKTNPPLVMITQFNECMAARFIAETSGALGSIRPGGAQVIGESIFVDLYNAEFNRDIEPSTHPLIRDNYYLQMVSHIRQYKGVRTIPTPVEAVSIRAGLSFDLWNNIYPEYRDDKGDVIHRSTLGFQKVAHMENTTGRNDIVVSKVTKDKKYISFYVRTAEDITDFDTSDQWMMLFINRDCNYSTGWYGYDYAIMKDNGNYCVMKNSGNKYSWTRVAEAPFDVQGNQMIVTIEKSWAELDGDVDFDFKWADITPANPDILDFIDKGDVAPNGRFNYRYKGSAINSSGTIPTGIESVKEDTRDLNITIRRIGGNDVTITTDKPSIAYIYTLSGMLISQHPFHYETTITLPAGLNILKVQTPDGVKAVKLQGK